MSAMFYMLESCTDNIDTGRLVYYMYIFQMSGFKLGFKYRINASGVSCRQINSLVNEAVNKGLIEVRSGVVYLTDLGYSSYYSTPFTLEEWDKIDYIKSVLSRLSESELAFICLTDMLVYGVLNKNGYTGLIEKELEIKNTLSSLSSEYSLENFNAAIKFISGVKGK